MIRCANIPKISAMVVAVLLTASCALAPSQVPEGIPLANDRIGVISITADYARLGHVGMTVFNNEHYYVPLDGFGLDDRIETELVGSLKDAGVSLVPITYDRHSLLRTYDTRDLDASMLLKPLWFKSDLSLIQDDLAELARKNRVNRLVIVVKAVCPDRFGRTNQSLNGFGLYHGRYASRGAWGGKSEFVTVPYLCAEAALLDPARHELIASRRVSQDGSLETGAPSVGVPYWTTNLATAPREQQDHIVGAFRKLAASVVPSVAALLGIPVTIHDPAK